MDTTKLCTGILILLLGGSNNYYYNSGDWPTIRHDQHNSDHIQKTIGDISQLTGLTELNWILKDQDHPSVLLTAVSLANIKGTESVLALTGKVNYPNLHVYDMEGNELWHSASAKAEEDAGPGSCAMASAALVDEQGNIYVGDCHHLFCYKFNGDENSNGDKKYKWKVKMPNLRQYKAYDKLWHKVDDPNLPDTMAKPFVSMFFTRKEANKVYLGGITTDGGIYIFDPKDGSLFASSHLIQPEPGEAIDWNSEGSCDPQDLTDRDDPMYYSFNPGNPDGIIPNGVWCTGVTPETNDPDADYFMNPCQIQSYLSSNTASTGAMVVNTPAVVKDPSDSNISRILINGSESPTLDTFPLSEDALLYRIDFNPLESTENRLIILNYEKDQNETPRFTGRMPGGENSGSSPPVTPDGKFIATGDNNGQFYLFSVETGKLIWRESIGTLLGSATLPQDPNPDGSYTIYTWGSSKLWVFNIDPDTGERLSTQVIDMVQYVIENYWRDDDPGYEVAYSKNNKDYEKAAVGASIIVATNDYLVLSYSVGWLHPDDPQAYLIPTHNVLLFINREKLFTAGESPDPLSIIDAHYIDIHGTLEQAAIFTTTQSDSLRGYLVYGSQSSTLAQFLDRNDKIPEPMKGLYVKPYGGIRIVEPQLSN